MLSAPLRLLTRASAGARARSAAPVSEVWAVLANPARWTEFEPFVSSVTPAATDPLFPEPGDDEITAGQGLVAQLRMLPVSFAVVVDHVVTRSSMVVTAYLLPGLSEEIEHLVIPSANGGSLLTVRITLHGPLALPSLLPRWWLRVLTVRLLARAAENELRVGDRAVSSVA
jgi:hypothetical protein